MHNDSLEDLSFLVKIKNGELVIPNKRELRKGGPF